MEKIEKTKKIEKRIIELDTLRGIAVFLMIFDHFMFNLFGILPTIFVDFPKSGTFFADVVKFAEFYWDWGVRNGVRYVVIFIFLGITGICCTFSKSNLKRGLKLLAVALLLTLATFIVGKIIGDLEITITFGVLHCIALTLIIIALLDKVIKNKWFYLIIGGVMVGFGIYFQTIREVVKLDSDLIFILLGKQMIGLVSSGGDSFPLLFNGGQIFIGVFLGKLLYDKKVSLFKNAHYSNNVVTFVGRNSLIVYVAHQIILPVIMGVILLICGYSLF